MGVGWEVKALLFPQILIHLPKSDAECNKTNCCTILLDCERSVMMNLCHCKMLCAHVSFEFTSCAGGVQSCAVNKLGATREQFSIGEVIDFSQKKRP